jgi:hypothetical protein
MIKKLSLIRRGFALRNPFVAPTLNVREEASESAFTDSREIFKHIKTHKEHMAFPEASRLLNDLSHVIIPFDKTQEEF